MFDQPASTSLTSELDNRRNTVKKQENLTTEESLLENRRAQAAGHYDAYYARLQGKEDGFLSVWTGKHATVWVKADDRTAYIEAIINAKGGSVYTPVTMRTIKSAEPFGHGTSQEVAHPQVLWVDFDEATPESGKVSCDEAGEGELGFARDLAQALSLLDSYEEKTGMKPHLLIRTPGGLQVYYLTDPLRTPYDQEIVGRFDTSFRSHLADQGVCIDPGVITQPTRLSRAAGSFHIKENKVTKAQTEPKPVTVHTVGVHEVYGLDFLRAALPATENRGSGLPVVDLDGSAISVRFSHALPISYLLEHDLGWKCLHTGEKTTSWNAGVKEAQSTDNAKTYTDEEFGFEKVRVWSATVATVLGLPEDHPFSSFEYLLTRYFKGDYGTAARLAERYLDKPLELLERVKTASLAELVDEGLKASGDWGKDLDAAGVARLKYRGVAPEVALARGYQTYTKANLPADRWGALTRHGGGSLFAANVHPIAPKNGVMGTLRAPECETQDEKGNISILAARGIPTTNYSAYVIDANPINLGQVADKSTPLVVVTGLDTNSSEPGSHGQVFADAVISASRREGVEVGVVALRNWGSSFNLAGTAFNASRGDSLGRDWSRVPLSDRTVYLAGRMNWREESGLIQLADLLAAKGATVKVINVDMKTKSQGISRTADTSTPGIGDVLAEAAYRGETNALQDLLNSSLPLEDARWESEVFVDTPLGHGQRLADVMAHEKNYLMDAAANAWAVDVGTHYKTGGAGTNPTTWAARELLKRNADIFTVRGLNSSVAFAGLDPRVQVVTSDFDRDAYALPVLNGVVNLRTTGSRPRRKGELNAKCVPIRYDPEAVSPTWLKHLDRVTCGDTELQDFLQRMFGMALIGEIIEERAYILYGGGRNGKTVTMNILQDLLGAFSMAIPAELFTGEAKPSQLASLQGIRAAIGAETGENDRANMAQIKALSNRGEMQASKKFGQEFLFNATHTLFLTTNHKMKVFDTSEGAWRRICLVPFLAQISAAEADPMLEAKLRAELPGILAWAVQGSAEIVRRVERLANGEELVGGVIGTCVAVDKANTEYREDNDLLGRFLASMCTVEKGRSVNRTELQAAFEMWREDEEGLKGSWSAQTVKNRLEERGITVRRTAKGRLYEGLDLTPPPFTEQEVDAEVASSPVPDSPAEIVEVPATRDTQVDITDGEVEL